MTDPKQLVTKDDLHDFYGQILPYLGGMPEVLANKFSKGDLYDTSEKMIGCWINGKPLYQKTVEITNPTVTNNEILVELLNFKVDLIVDSKFILKRSNGEILSNLKFYESSSDKATVFIAQATENPYFFIRSNYADIEKLYVTFQYTKTTDQANSFNIGEATDYSTDEKIVGTWITGEPIYQKTIYFGQAPNTTIKEVAHNISNFGRLVDIKATWKYDGNTNQGILPNINAAYSNANMGITCSDTVVRVDARGGDASSFIDIYFTLQYTKSTS